MARSGAREKAPDSGTAPRQDHECLNEMGYDTRTATLVDLMEADMIDPTQVSRSALQKAARVVGLRLTTQVLIAELPEKAQAFLLREPASHEVAPSSSFLPNAAASSYIKAKRGHLERRDRVP
jgi:hypothetical protein